MKIDPLGPRILIGESDPHLSVGLRGTMENLGLRVEICRNGAQLIEALQARPAPSTGLVDLGMPGFDAIQTREALEAQPEEDSTWMIAVYSTQSGSFEAFPEDVAAISLQAGFSDVISKPIAAVELILRLKTAERIQSLKERLRTSIEAASFEASHDSLTGLWNREALLPQLFQETDRVRRTGSPLALVLLDLDDFAQRNREFGYEVCDDVLRQLSVRLRRQLRSYDMVGRTGEDEFLIALPGCSLDDALVMAERMRVRIMHPPFHTRAGLVAVRASFGVAQSAGRSPLIVMREAEQALQTAKLAGRDRIRFYDRGFPGDRSLPVPKREIAASPHAAPGMKPLAIFPSPAAPHRDRNH